MVPVTFETPVLEDLIVDRERVREITAPGTRDVTDVDDLLQPKERNMVPIRECAKFFRRKITVRPLISPQLIEGWRSGSGPGNDAIYHRRDITGTL